MGRQKLEDKFPDDSIINLLLQIEDDKEPGIRATEILRRFGCGRANPKALEGSPEMGRQIRVDEEVLKRAIYDAMEDEFQFDESAPMSAAESIAACVARRLLETCAVWVDFVDGVPGTEKYINGTCDNPVNNLEDAEALMRSLDIDNIRFTEKLEALGSLMVGQQRLQELFREKEGKACPDCGRPLAVYMDSVGFKDGVMHAERVGVICGCGYDRVLAEADDTGE